MKGPVKALIAAAALVLLVSIPAASGEDDVAVEMPQNTSLLGIEPEDITACIIQAHELIREPAGATRTLIETYSGGMVKKESREEGCVKVVLDLFENGTMKTTDMNMTCTCAGIYSVIVDMKTQDLKTVYVLKSISPEPGRPPMTASATTPPPVNGTVNPPGRETPINLPIKCDIDCCSVTGKCTMRCYRV